MIVTGAIGAHGSNGCDCAGLVIQEPDETSSQRSTLFGSSIRFTHRGKRLWWPGWKPIRRESLLLDEEAWVRRAQRGEAGALTYLFETYFERVYRYTLLRLRDPSEAEDLTQQVFQRMLESIGRFEPRGAPFSSWLFRIAHNLIVDRVRQAKSKERAVAAVQAEMVAEDPEGEALVRLEGSEIRSLMERLTDAQRQVLELRFAAQLSIAETAEAMQRSIDAVKSMQYGALRALRALMAEREGTGVAAEPGACGL